LTIIPKGFFVTDTSVVPPPTELGRGFVHLPAKCNVQGEV
jgi:hypothetical protein